MSATTTMTTLAEATLAELEAIIDRGKQTFVEVGNALTEIRERKLYRKGYATFEDYCQQRHGFSSSRGRQLIAAAATVTAVTLSGGTPPTSEREARALAQERRHERWHAPGGGAERQAADRDEHLASLSPTERAIKARADYVAAAVDNEERKRRTLAPLEGLSDEWIEEQRLLWYPTPDERATRVARTLAAREESKEDAARMLRVARELAFAIDTGLTTRREVDCALLAHDHHTAWPALWKRIYQRAMRQPVDKAPTYTKDQRACMAARLVIEAERATHTAEPT
jgi:hypothetical protein